MRRCGAAIVLALALLAKDASADVSVSATVDPKVVPVGAEARLIVTVEGKFRNSSEPKLPQLDEFSVYQAGTSQSFSIVNGHQSSSIQYTFVLVPKQAGNFRIEPITFETDGKIYTAPAVSIEVVTAVSQLPMPETNDQGGEEDLEAKDPIFIRAWVDRDTVYVNQQVTWTLGFYTDGRVDLLRSPEYSPPSAEGFWVEDLPPNNNFYKMIDGRKYLVNELKRAYFPTVPGTYEIGSARVDLVIDDFGRGSADDFFSRRLRTFGFGKRVPLTTEPAKLVVLPLPTQGRPDDFSGLVGSNLELNVTTEEQVVRVGDPVTVTMEISGRGNFKTMAAPDFPEIDGFKRYESGSTSEVFKRDYVVSGHKKSDFVLIPRSEGEHVIPSIRMSYFDPIASGYRTIRSSPIRMDVQPGAEEQGSRIVFAGSGEDIEVLGRDINYIHSVPAAVTSGGEPIYTNRLFLGLHALPLLAVAASLVAARRRRRWLAQGPRARAMRAAREAEKRFDEALAVCRKNGALEAYAIVSAALREYLAAKMAVAAPGLTREDIEVFLDGHGVAEEDKREALAVLQRCDDAQYSGAGAGVAGAEETIHGAGAVIKRLEKSQL